MLQKPQSTWLQFQVEPFTLKVLDCEDCLTVTVIPLLPCKVQQAVAYIRCFKRGLVATFFHPEDCHGEWTSKPKGVWKLQAGPAGPAGSRGHSLWVCTSCFCLLLV